MVRWRHISKATFYIFVYLLFRKTILRLYLRPVFASQVQISFISRTDEDHSIWQLQIHRSRRLSLTDLLRFVLSPALRLPWHRRLWVVSCGQRNSFVPYYFFAFFLRVERARNCSLDSPVALAMDCGTVAQCVGVTPGPLCIAGMYACSVCLACTGVLFFLFFSFFLFLFSRKRDGG